MPKSLPRLIWLFLLLGTACTEDVAPGADDLPLGVSARAFLSEEDYGSLLVEMVYVTGFEPAETTIDSLRNFLMGYLNKPGGIEIRPRAIAPPGLDTYSLAEVIQIENTHRIVASSGTILTAFIFIADNKSEESLGRNKILGKAYGNTSMVIFQKDIQEMAAMTGTGVTESDLQLLTLKHEFGHLFGLVDNGSPAQSDHLYTDPKDQIETSHCSVEACLMARALDYTRGSLLKLCPECRTDLAANGGNAGNLSLGAAEQPQ